jgi:hypothetical protein
MVQEADPELPPHPSEQLADATLSPSLQFAPVLGFPTVPETPQLPPEVPVETW